MIIVLAILAVVMATMAIKVKRMVWKDDKILPFVLIFMTISVILFVFYFVVQVVIYSVPKWGSHNYNSYRYCFMYTYYSAILALVIGAVLNVHKWI